MTESARQDCIADIALITGRDGALWMEEFAVIAEIRPESGIHFVDSLSCGPVLSPAARVNLWAAILAAAPIGDRTRSGLFYHLSERFDPNTYALLVRTYESRLRILTCEPAHENPSCPRNTTIHER